MKRLQGLNKHALWYSWLLSPALAAVSLYGGFKDLAPVRQTSLIDAVWIEVKDGNDTARDIFSGHYSADVRFGQAKVLRGAQLLIMGPGEKMALISPDALALFGWRKFIDDSGQVGVNCCFFRNEGTGRASDLIIAADELAWERWPGERLYTYVDLRRVEHKRQPGRCFLKAGWRYCGWTKSGLKILHMLPDWRESGTASSTTTARSCSSPKGAS